MKIVEKWVAGFWLGKLIVVKCEFRETPEMFIMVKDDSKAYHDAKSATSYTTHFSKNEQGIFDTHEEALDALHVREMESIQKWQGYIEKCIGKLNQIDDFKLTSE